MTAVEGQLRVEAGQGALGALSPEDHSRAQVYRLLGRILGSAPDQPLLDALSDLDGDRSALGRAINTLATEARRADPVALTEAHFDLFIGLGRGELVPFASYYLTGFLQEKPLAYLRQDMTTLGIARDRSKAEPEDNVSSILTMMADLIEGHVGPGCDPLSDVASRASAERAFYDAHVGSWIGVFFRDLAAALSQPFYAAVGAVGVEFIRVEDEALRMLPRVVRPDLT